jgi:Peptidoglycan-binding protein, CsiV
MKTLRRLLPFLFAACCATAGAADLPPMQNAWFRVEVVIFERNSDPAGTTPSELLMQHGRREFPIAALAFSDDERIRTAVYPLDAATIAEPPFPTASAGGGEPTRIRVPVTTIPVATAASSSAQRAADVLAAYEAQLRNDSFRWQPASTFLLKQEDARLQRDGSYSVVLHGAWIQPVPDRDQPMPLLIQTGKRSASSWQIEGTIEVALGRYLHVDTRLWYRPDPGAVPGPPAASPDAVAIGADPRAEPDAEAYMELREQRRLRSGELHYFDHPKFGMLVRIDPVLMPDSLLAQLTAILGETIAQPVVAPADDGESFPTGDAGRD